MLIIKKISVKFILAVIFLISGYIYAQYDNSRFVSQSIPSSMVPGGSYTILVTYENTGSTYWSPYDYKLNILPGPYMGATSTWGTSTRDLVSTVEPGKTVTFEFPVTAPYSSGVYSLQTQLTRGSSYFGQGSYASVDVSSSYPPPYPPPYPPITTIPNNSSFIDQTVSSVMIVGEPSKVIITMKNTGTLAWTMARYRLVNLNNTDANVNLWGTTSIELDETVVPGQTKSFAFLVTPPLFGSNLFQWRMSSTDGGLFGEASVPVYVTVQTKTGSIEDRNAFRSTTITGVPAEKAIGD